MNTGLIIKIASVILLLIVVNTPIPTQGSAEVYSQKSQDTLLSSAEVSEALIEDEKDEIIQRLDRQIQLLQELKQEIKTLEYATKAGN